MGIFDSFFSGGGISGGSVVDSVLGGLGGNILNEIILRQTTSEEQRAVTGRGLPGDTPFGGVDLSRVLGGLPQFGGQPVAGNGLGFLENLTGTAFGSVSAAPCPTQGTTVPSGTCMTINDVVSTGAKGMCYIGVSGGGTPILKKRSRTRRKRMFTASDKSDIQWALSVAGSPKGPATLAAIMLRSKR